MKTKQFYLFQWRYCVPAALGGSAMQGHFSTHFGKGAASCVFLSSFKNLHNQGLTRGGHENDDLQSVTSFIKRTTTTQKQDLWDGEVVQKTA
eukprot:g20709.t1